MSRQLARVKNRPVISSVTNSPRGPDEGDRSTDVIDLISNLPETQRFQPAMSALLPTSDNESIHSDALTAIMNAPTESREKFSGSSDIIFNNHEGVDVSKMFDSMDRVDPKMRLEFSPEHDILMSTTPIREKSNINEGFEIIASIPTPYKPPFEPGNIAGLTPALNRESSADFPTTQNKKMKYYENQKADFESVNILSRMPKMKDVAFKPKFNTEEVNKPFSRRAFRNISETLSNCSSELFSKMPEVSDFTPAKVFTLADENDSIATKDSGSLNILSMLPRAKNQAFKPAEMTNFSDEEPEEK